MEKSLVPDKKLSELLNPLTKGQRQYIYLRLMDIPEKEALKIAKLKKHSYYVWRSDKSFAELEDYVIGQKDKYAQEAFANFIYNLGAKAQLVLDTLVNKALDWDSLQQGDKAYVMRAVELISKMSPKGEGSKESYEEMIFRRRTK